MNNKPSSTALLTALLIVAVVVIAWLFVSLKQTERQADQASQTIEAQKQADIAAKQAEVVQNEIDQENKLKVSWPSRGSSLCYEVQQSVSWQAPADMDVVTLTLYTPNTALTLGDFPAVTGTGSDNTGYGSYQWDLTDATGNVVPTSKVYKISISGMYHGHQISTSTDGVFSIDNCNR